jgi:signal transduction histidine kinase
MRAALLIAIVAIALAVVIGVDVWGARSAQRAANEIFDDATRSIELVEDMRWQLHKLVHIGDRPLQPIIDRLDADIAAYAPLATFEGEALAWASVRDQVVLSLDAARRGDIATVRERDDAINDSIEQLVSINGQEARSLAQRMASNRRVEILGDIIAVLAAGLIIAILGVRLSRAQARERMLIAENLRRAEDRNRELDAFAGRAAHDLRSPLNPIRGYAELISTDSNAPPDTRRQASLIIRGVQRMARVIDDMLALSRAGHPEAGSASVAQVVTRVREELAPELSDADVTTEVDDVYVGCNDISLEQLLRNLVGNAAKFRSPERRLEIRVTAKRTGDGVEVAVMDNGIGMDLESMKHAFDPFYRGRRDIAGTGLGLSIVERLTRAHGGSCTIDLGHAPGTRVVVALPEARARG